MKKITALLLTFLMLAASLTGCGTASSTSAPAEGAKKPYKVAIATIFEGESWEIQKKYYEQEVAPALNMEFMFSEKLSDANGLVDFMDKAYAAGCEATINYVTASDAVAQGARKAEEWGMWFITQNSSLNKDVAGLQYNLGHCGASAKGMATAYGNAFDKILSDGKTHNLFIYSVAAVGGEIGQGAASHYYSVYGMLEAMQKKYNLTYEKSISDIINTQDPGEVATGNPDVKIYVCPGFDPAAALTTAQTQFQSGEYDIFAAVAYYAVFTNALSDIEKSKNNDIQIIGTASIEQQTFTGFTTKDSFGNTVLNAAVLNPLNNANGICAAIVYNALTGNAAAMKDGGNAVLFKVEPWACADATTYEKISKLDTSSETYVLNGADLKALCVENDATVTFKTIEAKLAELGDVDAVLASKIK